MFVKGLEAWSRAKDKPGYLVTVDIYEKFGRMAVTYLGVSRNFFFLTGLRTMFFG